MIKTAEVKTVSFSQELSQAAPNDQSPVEDKITTSLPFYAKVNDASSGDSGDSEIELVSEETSPLAPTAAYISLSKSISSSASAPTQETPTVHVPLSDPVLAQAAHNTAMQYSILREEREAELDSELALESCEEESPKRFSQDSKTKASKVDSEHSETPSPLTTTSAAPPATPVPPPAPQVTKNYKEKTPGEAVKEKPSPTSKPSALSGFVPETKLEQPSEEKETDRRCSSSARHETPLIIFHGMSKEKGKSSLCKHS